MADRKLFFITHAEVEIDPNVEVTDWPLSTRGQARHELFSQRAEMSTVRTIYSSAERKARDGAEILAATLNLSTHVEEKLREDDRSAAGYLPREEFESVADAFFERAEESVRGWERAVDAQIRIVEACQRIAADHQVGDIAIVAHGGVGALLLSHLKGIPISRAYDQPGHGGGNYLVVKLPKWTLEREWRDIAPMSV
mgnify:CR=1 FL=1